MPLQVGEGSLLLGNLVIVVGGVEKHLCYTCPRLGPGPGLVHDGRRSPRPCPWRGLEKQLSAWPLEEHDTHFMPQALIGWSEGTSVAYKKQTAWRLTEEQRSLASD